jgi:hypothetical protein
MNVEIAFGSELLKLEVADSNAVPTHRQPHTPDLTDPAEAMRRALEAPLRFPPLRQALTPDDHLALVMDERLPVISGLLPPLFEHLALSDIAISAITIVYPSEECRQRWLAGSAAPRLSASET